MPINLVEIVQGSIGTQMGQIGIIIGESESDSSAAVNLAIPTLLAGLRKKTASREGAEHLHRALNAYDGSRMDNLRASLCGGNHFDLLVKGDALLHLVFGSARSAIQGRLATDSGISANKMGTVLSLLSPMLMGVIGKQRRTQSLDVDGVANFLASQSDFVQDALVSELPESTRLRDERSQDTMVGLAPNLSKAAHTDRQSAPSVGAASASGGNLLLSLLPLAILGVLAFWAFNAFERDSTVRGNNLASPKLESANSASEN